MPSLGKNDVTYKLIERVVVESNTIVHTTTV